MFAAPEGTEGRGPPPKSRVPPVVSGDDHVPVVVDGRRLTGLVTSATQAACPRLTVPSDASIMATTMSSSINVGRRCRLEQAGRGARSSEVEFQSGTALSALPQDDEGIHARVRTIGDERAIAQIDGMRRDKDGRASSRGAGERGVVAESRTTSEQGVDRIGVEVQSRR